MGHKVLMVLLGLGAVAGFASGFSHLCYGFGPGGRMARHQGFERRVADTCTESALRVYTQKAAAERKP